MKPVFNFLYKHLWMKPALQKSLLHLQKRVWGDDPAQSPALQPLHVHCGVHQVTLQDLRGERIESLQVKVVREKGEHRWMADRNARVAKVETQLNLGDRGVNEIEADSPGRVGRVQWGSCRKCCQTSEQQRSMNGGKCQHTGQHKLT